MSTLKFGSKGFYGLIARRLNDLVPVTLPQADLDDIRQDAFCRILQCHKSQQFTSALVRACVDRSVRQWRRNKRRELQELTDDGAALNEVRHGELSDLDRIYLRIDLEKIQDELTSRQLDICRMLANGLTPRRIAKNLQESPRVISSEMDVVRQKIQQAGWSLISTSGTT